MKKTLMLAAAAAGIAFAAFATDYEWTGGANDGKWTNVGNWKLYNSSTAASDYPRTTADYARFTSSATVSVDTGTKLVVGLIAVHGNAGTVTLNGTAGSSLDLNKSAAANGSSFMVLEGSKLVVNLPVETAARIDKWQSGDIEFTANVTSTAASNPFVVDNGKATLSGTATLSAVNGAASVGNYTNGDTATLELKDAATFAAKEIMTGINGNNAASAVGHVIQNGAGTVVNATAGLRLATAANHTKPSIYELKAGTLSVGGTITVGENSVAQFTQVGGTSTCAKVTLANGSTATLKGGVMNVPSLADITVGSGCAFSLDGGTLALSEGTFTSWRDCLDKVGAKLTVAPGSSVALNGDSLLAIPSSCSTYDVGLEIGEGKTVEVPSGAVISAPAGSTNAWKVTLNEGSVLKLDEATARLAVPLDLTVNGSGKIQMYSNASGFEGGFRGAVVAHRLVVDGAEKGKGRYNAAANSFLSAGLSAGTAGSVTAGASIIVPYVWTGAGADDNWNTGANWEGGAVPPSGSPVDVSRASTITLGDNVTVSCLVAIPNNPNRKTTVTGSGTISIAGDDNACCLYVPVGCELVLDVDFKRTSNNLMGMVGGGTLTCRKSAPINQKGGKIYPLLALDGRMVLDGVNTLHQYDGESNKFINYHSSNPNVQGELAISGSSVISVGRLSEGYPDSMNSIMVRQTGGKTTYSNFWIQNLSGLTPADAVGYVLEDGEMNASGGMYLGYTQQVSANSAYPGGSFEMSGGTLNCGEIRGSCNQNYVRLYGGNVYLTGNLTILRIPDAYVKQRNENAITFYLGGVTIHPTSKGYKLQSDAYLTGKNGDVKFALDSYAFLLDTGNTVSGPGGVEVTSAAGTYALTCKANCTFTGSLTLSGANNNFNFADGSTINGPSAFIVKSATAKIDIYTSCTISKSPDVVVLASQDCLTLGTGKNLTVKHLVVGGTDYAAGTYTFGSGSVTVSARPASWLVGTVGDLSYMADGTATAVDSATTLSSLVYEPAAAGMTNTLTGAALTFADGANIHVAKGDALVIDNDVVFGGKVTKTGWGEVVFNGAVSGAATPTAASDGTDPRWLTVIEGGAAFDDAVEGVRIATRGAIDANGTPVVTLKEHCRVRNYGIVLTAWNAENVTACCGETRQEGAIVDYSTMFDSVRNNSNWALAQPRSGGCGRYVLDSGEIRSPSDRHLSFLLTSSESGSFDFVQNGGTFSVPKDFYFARKADGVTCAYTLNNGRFEFGGALVGVANPSRNVINLNGGTYAAGRSDTIDREKFTLTTGGIVTFEVADGKTLTIADDSRSAGSLVKTGAGSLVLDGAIALNGLDVQAGSATLTGKMLPFANDDATLSIAKAATLSLDYDGRMTFKTLSAGGIECAPGVYSASKGSPRVKRRLGGTGELDVLAGYGIGGAVIIR